jgi:hypothetical protein
MIVLENLLSRKLQEYRTNKNSQVHRHWSLGLIKKIRDPVKKIRDPKKKIMDPKKM